MSERESRQGKQRFEKVREIPEASLFSLAATPGALPFKEGPDDIDGSDRSLFGGGNGEGLLL